jgi:threonine dehydrogenase-like Zn-dependent dehydrogenase
MGASLVIGVDMLPNRLDMAKKMGADVVINSKEQDPIAEVKRLTEGRGADVAIEALGKQETFDKCLRSVRPGGTISSLGVYPGNIEVAVEPYVYGIGDIIVVSTLCPGGKERMRRLMEMVRTKKLNLKQLLTHHFLLDNVLDAYDLFSNQRDGVLKVAITPQPVEFRPRIAEEAPQTEPEEVEALRSWSSI